MEILIGLYLIIGLIVSWACAADSMVEIICIAFFWLPILVLVLPVIPPIPLRIALAGLPPSCRLADECSDDREKEALCLSRTCPGCHDNIVSVDD